MSHYHEQLDMTGLLYAMAHHEIATAANPHPLAQAIIAAAMFPVHTLRDPDLLDGDEHEKAQDAHVYYDYLKARLLYEAVMFQNCWAEEGNHAELVAAGQDYAAEGCHAMYMDKITEALKE